MEAKNGDAVRMALVLPCQVQGDDEQHIDYKLYFTRQLIASGKNAGKSLYDISSETCIELGMSRPFNPCNIAQLDGMDASVVMREEEYEGKRSVRPAFINPMKKRLAMEDVSNIWASMTGAKVQPPVKKMEQHKATAYMVNTGWNGTGKRISIKDTRAIIDAILDGSIEKAETKMVPIFNFEVPTHLHEVDSNILDPRNTYGDAQEWYEKAENLASKFIKNFAQYTANDEGLNLVKAGPQTN
jgi:hypothetical protein